MCKWDFTRFDFVWNNPIVQPKVIIIRISSLVMKTGTLLLLKLFIICFAQELYIHIWNKGITHHGIPEELDPLSLTHCIDVTMTTMASQITSLTVIYSIVYSGADQRKHQSSASLAFVRGIHRDPVNSPQKGPVTRKMFPFDDVIMMSEVKSQHWWVITALWMWGEITYPFPNLIDTTVKVWEGLNNFIPYLTGHESLIHVGINVNPF